MDNLKLVVNNYLSYWLSNYIFSVIKVFIFINSYFWIKKRTFAPLIFSCNCIIRKYRKIFFLHKIELEKLWQLTVLSQ